jgi:hypothetical protein
MGPRVMIECLSRAARVEAGVKESDEKGGRRKEQGASAARVEAGTRLASTATLTGAQGRGVLTGAQGRAGCAQGRSWGRGGRVARGAAASLARKPRPVKFVRVLAVVGTCPRFPKIFSQAVTSNLRYMHETLNINKKN